MFAQLTAYLASRGVMGIEGAQFLEVAQHAELVRRACLAMGRRYRASETEPHQFCYSMENVASQALTSSGLSCSAPGNSSLYSVGLRVKAELFCALS